MTRIAMVGMACRYPDATSPRELWENALAGRRAFRRLPDVRMRLEDYWDADPAAPDRFYARNAAVIEGYEFDRIAYKIAGSTYRVDRPDPLAGAGHRRAWHWRTPASRWPRDCPGSVPVWSSATALPASSPAPTRCGCDGRTCGGWSPRRCKEQDWDDDQLASFLDDFEERYKTPFPAIDEDTLAGGAVQHDRRPDLQPLRPQGRRLHRRRRLLVLAAVGSDRLQALVDGEIDVAIAGGVDLSIDPFEIVGFAKTGALARGEMRVYDRSSNGFWPGEGCGMVVLMRAAEARARPVTGSTPRSPAGASPPTARAASPGPRSSGYRLALRPGVRAGRLRYRHGGRVRGPRHRHRGRRRHRTEGALGAPAGRPIRPVAPAAISSIKGMIGHTKAAAGVAGLIKAAMAVHHQVLPPTIGCVDPHDCSTEDRRALRVLRQAEAVAGRRPGPGRRHRDGLRRASTPMSCSKTVVRRRRASARITRTRALAASIQDTELLLLDAGSAAGTARPGWPSWSSSCPASPTPSWPTWPPRSSVNCATCPTARPSWSPRPEDAERRLRHGRDALDAGETSCSPRTAVFLGRASGPARIGYLFPGQGSGRGTSGGALRRRFAEAHEVYDQRRPARRRRRGGDRGRPAADRHRLAGRPAGPVRCSA